MIKISVIAARVTDKYIHVAADSILLKEELKRTENFSKLISVNNMIVGGCGSAEELSLFQRYATYNKPSEGSIFAVQDFMKSFSRWKEQYTDSITIDNCYLIVYEHKLFEIDGLFVHEISDYTAIGEGEPYALTALHLGCVATEAVKVTCDLCCYTAEPIIDYFDIKKV